MCRGQSDHWLKGHGPLGVGLDAVAPKPKGPRVKVTDGDVFQIPIDLHRLGYGQVVGSRPSTLLVAIFKKLHSRLTAADISQIVLDEVAFLAETFDAKIWSGDWPIVGHAPPDHVRIPFPWYKVTIDRATNWYVESYDTTLRRPAMPWEIDSLLLRNVVSPIRLEKALQALHGIGRWDPSYRLMEFEVMRRSSEGVATEPRFSVPRPNIIESDTGFSVERLPRAGLRYYEGGRSLLIDSEMLTEGFAIFTDSIKRWDPPDESKVSEQERKRILENVRLALASQGERAKFSH